MLDEKYLKYYDREAISKIWTLAWPVMVGQLLHTMMVIADMWFIAKLGSVEAAAAGTGTSLIGVIHVFPALVASGAIALVARFTGAEDEKNIKAITVNGIFLSIIAGLITMVLSFIFVDQLLWIFGDADKTLLGLAKEYITVALIGVPFFFYNATTRAVVQATGDTKNPVKVFVFANIVNILLDYFFIMVLGKGIGGAAAATVIAEISAFTLMSILVFRNIYKGQIKSLVNSLSINLGMAIRILKIGIFAVLQMITRPFTGLIMFRIVLAQGVAAGAAFGIGGRMFNFVFIFLAGLGTAMSVMVGQSLGKKDYAAVDQLIKQGKALATFNMLIFAIPFYIFPKLLIGAFVQDAEVIQIGAEYLRITYTGVLFVVFPVTYGSAFAGAGDTFPPMLASILGNWGIKIPLAYILTHFFSFSATGVWWAIALSVVMEAIVLTIWFYKGKWKEKKI
ncbi:MATE family efflux transporter [Alkaliphilus serpentinus]|nr:MATE family efflux transporter [Alkaliphilus serpentinus]